jgi:protease I
VLAEEIYQEMELWVPYYRLKEEGADVKIVAPEKKTYKSKLGYPVNADMAAADVSGKDFDGVVIPGGYAPDMMRRYPAMLNLVRDCFSRASRLAAICHGLGCGLSGSFCGKTATCFFAIKDDLITPAPSTWMKRWWWTGTSSSGRRAICRPSAELVNALK